VAGVAAAVAIPAARVPRRSPGIGSGVSAPSVDGSARGPNGDTRNGRRRVAGVVSGRKGSAADGVAAAAPDGGDAGRLDARNRRRRWAPATVAGVAAAAASSAAAAASGDDVERVDPTARRRRLAPDGVAVAAADGSDGDRLDAVARRRRLTPVVVTDKAAAAASVAAASAAPAALVTDGDGCAPGRPLAAIGATRPPRGVAGACAHASCASRAAADRCRAPHTRHARRFGDGGDPSRLPAAALRRRRVGAAVDRTGVPLLLLRPLRHDRPSRSTSLTMHRVSLVDELRSEVAAACAAAAASTAAAAASAAAAAATTAAASATSAASATATACATSAASAPPPMVAASATPAASAAPPPAAAASGDRR